MRWLIDIAFSPCSSFYRIRHFASRHRHKIVPTIPPPHQCEYRLTICAINTPSPCAVLNVFDACAVLAIAPSLNFFAMEYLAFAMLTEGTCCRNLATEVFEPLNAQLVIHRCRVASVCNGLRCGSCGLNVAKQSAIGLAIASDDLLEGGHSLA